MLNRLLAYPLYTLLGTVLLIMTVKELITKLLDYNINAEILVVAHCRQEEFTLSYGSSENVTKENCDTVSIYVDRLCTNEQANEVS